MAENKWKDRMGALLRRKGWDIKDWHRATNMNQRKLETLMGMDVSGISEEGLENIYEQARTSKLDKKMLRFDEPVMIAVWANKGGTGKSTTATNLSYELAKKGYNVLAIDTDSQSDMTSVLFPEYLKEPNVNFYDAFMGQEDFQEEGYIQHTAYENLDIIAGSQESEGLEGTMCTLNEKIRNKMWKKCLRTIREEGYYDFIIVDMDKTAGVMNKSILNETDYVLAPIESAMFAVKSVPPILAQIEEMKETNPKLQLLGLLYNKVDMRKKGTMSENMALIEQIAPGCAFKTFIKNDANVDNSQKEHMPIGYYNRRSPASIQMVEFTEELLEKIERNRSMRGGE